MSPAIFGVAFLMYIARAKSKSRRFIVFRGVLVVTLTPWKHIGQTHTYPK
jgi:hypothetical protein